METKKLLALALGTLAAAVGSVGAATIVGPNVYGDGAVDTAGTGQRANISVANSVTLPQGTYSATDFKFNNEVSGTDVEPFLAIVTSGTAGNLNEVYQVIAAGIDRTSLTTGVQTVSFGGSNTFTVPAGGETIYAGITNVASDNGITTDAGGLAVPGNDSHFVTGPHSVSVGSTLAVGPTNGGSFDGSATYELARHYDFAITIVSTPEPASIGLLGLGAMGLLARRRSR